MAMTAYPTPIPVGERLTLKTRFPDEEDCALCLQSMKGDLVMRMPCGHHYHERCHAQLRETSGSYRYRCPTCRHNVKEQLQRLKVYELWGEDLWDQFQCYVRGLDGGAAPWETASGKRRLDTFERWLIEGLEQEELEELFERSDIEPDIEPDSQPANPPQNSDVPPISPISHGNLERGEGLDASLDGSDEYWEQYFASITLSDDDESQPDSP